MPRLLQLIISAFRKSQPAFPPSAAPMPDCKIDQVTYRKFFRSKIAKLPYGHLFVVLLELDAVVAAATRSGEIHFLIVGGNLLRDDRDSDSGSLLLVVSQTLADQLRPGFIRLLGAAQPAPSDDVKQIKQLQKVLISRCVRLDIRGADDADGIATALSYAASDGSQAAQEGIVICSDVKPCYSPDGRSYPDGIVRRLTKPLRQLARVFQ